MLWFLVILLVIGLSIVLFHKRPLNTAGAGWVPPEQRIPPPAAPAKTDELQPPADRTGA